LHFLINIFDDRSKDGYFARLKLGKAMMNKNVYLFQAVFSKVMPTVTLQHLANVFKIFGPFEELSLEMKAGSEEHTGHGTVTFLSPESAFQLDLPFNTLKINVNFNFFFFL